MTTLSPAFHGKFMRLLHDLPDDPEIAGLNESKDKHMKAKTILWVALAAGLLAGCASEKSEQTKQARLGAKAKIAKVDAEKSALAQVPNGTVKEAEIEKEHGKLIWSFDLTVPDSKDIKEVAVDALTGQVVSVETETAEQEAKEKD
ncbi:MAG TPA: PepSY domain-containing protein, partial [Verrucomicrobiae bacterium]|nr:PepSY domain-containing protein [Verrucomicrobiae bacterium]